MQIEDYFKTAENYVLTLLLFRQPNNHQNIWLTSILGYFKLINNLVLKRFTGRFTGGFKANPLSSPPPLQLCMF